MYTEVKKISEKENNLYFIYYILDDGSLSDYHKIISGLF